MLRPNRHSISRAVLKAGFGGDGLVDRIRTVYVAMLGLTAAAALALVAFVANQGLPDVGALLPGLPVHHQAISGGSIVAAPALEHGPYRSLAAATAAGTPARHGAATPPGPAGSRHTGQPVAGREAAPAAGVIVKGPRSGGLNSSPHSGSGAAATTPVAQPAAPAASPSSTTVSIPAPTSSTSSPTSSPSRTTTPSQGSEPSGHAYGWRGESPGHGPPTSSNGHEGHGSPSWGGSQPSGPSPSSGAPSSGGDSLWGGSGHYHGPPPSHGAPPPPPPAAPPASPPAAPPPAPPVVESGSQSPAPSWGSGHGHGYGHYR